MNSPSGFVKNFGGKLDKLRAMDGTLPPRLKDIQPVDVLGYYEANDLPFFKFLVDHYAYCERFFCSHPGPTLPNRMLSLLGDVQYDRTGEAILDNNHGDNFVLSRAMTLFDLLTRKKVPWRVYESFPSVAMLRMFARYATDATNIVRLDGLARRR